MTASNTKDLRISQTIDILESHLSEIRKEMPWYNDLFMIVPEEGNVELLSDIIAAVNLDLHEEVLEQIQLVALDASGFKDWFAMVKGAIPFALIWAGLKRACGASRCSLRIKVGDSEIDVTAATPEEAERLFKCASRIIITKNRDPQLPDPPIAADARLDNRP